MISFVSEGKICSTFDNVFEIREMVMHVMCILECFYFLFFCRIFKE